MVVFIIKIGIFLLNIIYFFIKLFSTRNKITMISRQSSKETMDFRLIREEIEKRDKNVKIVILCRELDGGINSTILNKIKYGFHMITQMYHIATSKVVILDSYCIVISILKHKKKLKVIQIWHSMGTMKKFGYTVLGLKEGSSAKIAYTMKMHNNYDYIFASNEAYKEHLASGFNCDINKILTYPLPRYDLLKDNKWQNRHRKEIEEYYPILRKKKNIIYCPTFRKDESDFQDALNKLVNAIDTKKYNLIVKLHPLSKVILNNDNDDSIIVDRNFPTFDMLSVADYVISDYSCVIYEAAIKDIPLYFYNFDIDLYDNVRGLAIDYYKELPGIISKDPKDIIKDIEKDNYDLVRLKKFTDKYVKTTKGATKDIVDFIFKIKEK